MHVFIEYWKVTDGQTELLYYNAARFIGMATTHIHGVRPADETYVINRSPYR